MGILVNSFSLEDLMFLLVGAIIGIAIGAYYFYEEEGKVHKLLKEDLNIVRNELNAIRVILPKDDYLKNEAMAFYEWFILHRDDKNLHEFPSRNNTWHEYQKSKVN